MSIKCGCGVITLTSCYVLWLANECQLAGGSNPPYAKGDHVGENTSILWRFLWAHDPQ